MGERNDTRRSKTKIIGRCRGRAESVDIGPVDHDRNRPWRLVRERHHIGTAAISCRECHRHNISIGHPDTRLDNGEPTQRTLSHSRRLSGVM
jgi:hypothetical protein